MKMNNSDAEKVSVVIPVYNAEAYLEQTLESVFAQTYPNIEIVIVDDGSKDGSIALLEKYADRVRLVRQANSGAAAARNHGVQEASGVWIAFLDADDIWAPDKIEHQLRVCGNYAWSHTDSIFLGGVNDGRKDSGFTKKHQGQVLREVMCENFIGTSTLMIRREIFLNSGGFDESFRSIHDWELWTRLASKHALGYVDAPLLTYRVHSVSVSRNTRKTLPNHIRVIEKAFSQVGPAASLAHMKRSALARSYSICSHIAEEEGDYAFSLKCAFNAAQNEPEQFHRWVRTVKSFIKYLLRNVVLKR
jgi:glycosyltransferase involved in cell wall biosynthesis